MITFAHISDLHIAPLPNVHFGQLLSKRILGYLSWQRKRKHAHELSVLEHLRADLIAKKPDHLCITGDIVNISLEDEYLGATAFLKTLGDTEDISLVPGNHDAYVKAGEARIVKHYAPWMQGDNSEATFPYIKTKKDVAFIGLSSAVATPPFMATGKLGDKQLQDLKQLLANLPEAINLCVVLIHHPPKDGISKPRKMLLDVKKLEEIMVTSPKPTIMLHGHLHKRKHNKLNNIHIFGAGSASCNGNLGFAPAHYQLFKWKNGELSIEHHEYDPKMQSFVQASERMPIALTD